MQDDDFVLAEKFVGHPDVIRQLANEFKRIRTANRDHAQVLYDGELETEIIRLRAENERLRASLRDLTHERFDASYQRGEQWAVNAHAKARDALRKRTDNE